MQSLRDFIIENMSNCEALLHVTNSRCKQQFYAGMIKAYAEILKEMGDVVN